MNKKIDHYTMRDNLMLAVKQLIANKGWSQRKAAEMLGLTQPNVSLLMRGIISKFSVRSLNDILLRINSINDSDEVQFDRMAAKRKLHIKQSSVVDAIKKLKTFTLDELSVELKKSTGLGIKNQALRSKVVVAGKELTLESTKVIGNGNIIKYTLLSTEPSGVAKSKSIMRARNKWGPGMIGKPGTTIVRMGV